MTDNVLEAYARNKNVARGKLRTLSLSELEKISEIIEAVLNEKHQEADRRKEDEQAKARKVAEIQAALSETGLSVEDLLSAEGTPRRRGRPRKE